MDKKTAIVILLVAGVLLVNSLAFARLSSSDDWDRTLKDIQRDLRHQSFKNIELQKDYRFSPQTISPSLRKMDLKGLPTTDRAMKKNQERLKKMLDEQKKAISQSLEDWGLVIPKKYRLAVNLTAICVFVAFFSFIFYKQREKNIKEKKSGEDDRLDDGIRFYKS